MRSPDGFEVPARRSADEYATGGGYSPDIGPDGPGIVDDEDPDSEEEPSDVEEDDRDPEEPDEDETVTDWTRALVY